VKWVMGLEMDGGVGMGLREGWRDDVRVSYERGVDELVRLSGFKTHNGSVSGNGNDNGRGGSLTETVGKVQRARTVALEFD
jgi:hypothetical protein